MESTPGAISQEGMHHSALRTDAGVICAQQSRALQDLWRRPFEPLPVRGALSRTEQPTPRQTE
jgi:hypothetical protein